MGKLNGGIDARVTSRVDEGCDRPSNGSQGQWTPFDERPMGVKWAGRDYPGLSVEQLAAVRRDWKQRAPLATSAQIDAAIKVVLAPGSRIDRDEVLAPYMVSAPSDAFERLCGGLPLSRWKPTGDGKDVPDIPEFLRRRG